MEGAEMDKKNRKVPKLRFPDFTDDWEQRKVGEIAGKTYGGGTPKTSVNEYWGGKIPWIQSSNLSEHQLFDADIQKHITEQGLQKSATQLVPKNSIAVVSHVGVGKLVFMPFEYTTSQDFISLSELNTEPVFTCYALYKRLQEDLHIVQGSAIKGITKEDLLNKEISIPSFDEQRRIGDTLQNIDNLITLHQRKLDQMKKYKKGMLQKMFPQNGENEPEIRFPGFTGAWEQRKLGEVIEDYIEKTTVEDQYPVLTSSQQKGIVLQDEYFAGQRVSQGGNVGYFVIPRGYFAYRSRSDNDVFVFNRNDAVDIGIISYFYPVFKPKDTDSDFLLRRLNYGLEEQIKINSEGTGQHVLSLKKFKNMIGLFPSLGEQQKIGAFFENLDNLITLHQRKVDLMISYKKGLLQKMFI